MPFPSWLLPRKGRPKQPSRLRCPWRPGLERLEDRLAPAILTVNSTADTSVRDNFLTLREAVRLANGVLDPAVLTAAELAQVSGTLANAAGRDTIHFSIGAGTQTIAPTGTDLDIISQAVEIDGIAPAAFPTQRIEISGQNFTSGLHNGLKISAGNSIVRGLTINRFSSSQIQLITNGSNLIVGNFLGTDVTGSAKPPGTLPAGALPAGIDVDNTAGNIIGGTTAADRNVLSGNSRGIYIHGTTSAATNNARDNLVQGNYIGTDAAGNAKIGNDFGVYLFAAHHNTMGGIAPGAGNVISGNNAYGIITSGGVATLSDANVIQGNYIGANAAANAALPNPIGIRLGWGDRQVIGGTAAGAGNLIASTSSGIKIDRTQGTRIQGNRIGTGLNGTEDWGFSSIGIDIAGLSAATNNLIGGLDEDDGTVDGILRAGNLIAFSGIGILLQKPGGSENNSNAILGNSIYANDGLGINLRSSTTEIANGVTPNDEPSSPYDTDTGANFGQNFPVLTALTKLGGNLRIEGMLKSTAATTFRLEFFTNPTPELPSHHGEGRTFLGAVNVTTDATGLADFTGANALTLPVNLQGTHYITATASPITWDHDNDPATPLYPTSTSEFSQEFQFVGSVNGPPTPLSDTAQTDEDAPVSISVASVLANDTDPDNDALRVTRVVSATHGSATLNDRGTLLDPSDDTIDFVPAPNYHSAISGPAQITYEVSDGAATATAVITVTINALNDPPTFISGGNEAALVNDPPQSRAWASNISPGPADEVMAGQTVSFIVTHNTNSALFTAGGQPAVDANGQLTFEPAPGMTGSADITVVARDSLNLDSAPVTFTITVAAAANAPPSFDPLADQVVPEGTPQDVTIANVSPGPAFESGQSVAFTATWDNHDLIESITITPASGAGVATRTLSYVLKPGVHGTATVTVTALDDGGRANGGDDETNDVFIITVDPDNTAPVAMDGTFTTSSGEFFGNPIAIDLRILVSDAETPDNDLIYEIVAPPNATSFPLNPSGFDHTIVPVGGFVGMITFTYRVTDLGDGNAAPETSEIKTVTIEVVAQRPDLRVFLTNTPDPAVFGEDLKYTIRVENHGGIAATNVQVGLLLPTQVVRNGRRIVGFRPQAELVVIFPETNGHNVTHQVLPSFLGETTLQFQFGLPLRPVSEGDVATIEILVRPLVANTAITAQAGATSAQADANPADNAATATTFVNAPKADLAVRVLPSPDPVLVGNLLTYQIQITNNGPQDAQDVRIKHVLPFKMVNGNRVALLGEVTIEAGQGTWDGPNANQVIHGRLPTLLRGETVTVFVRGRVLAKAANRALISQVSVESSTGDPVGNNNTATAITQARPRVADVCVQVIDTPDPVIVGDQVTYQIEVVNNGPQDAHNVKIIIVLPFIPGTGQALLGNLMVGTPSLGLAPQAANQVTWRIGTLASGATATLTITGAVKPLASGRTLSARVTVMADEADSNTANNEARATTQVLRAPDLSVSMTGSASQVKVNTPVIYTIKVKNHGPVADPRVLLTIDLPAGATFVSVTPSQGAVGPLNGTLRVDLGQLTAGQVKTLQLKLIPRTVSQLLIIASVAGTKLDPNLGNNTVTLTTTAGPQIELIQSGAFEPIQPGTPNPWTLTGGANIVRGHLELRPDRGKQQAAVQTVSIPIPVNTVTLTFNLTIAARDPRNQLIVEVLLGGFIPFPLLVLNGNAANGPYTIDLSAFQGQTLGLQFRAVTTNQHDINFTNFKIDDVSLCAM